MHYLACLLMLLVLGLISVNRATMKAEKPPIARQSCLVFGWNSVKAKKSVKTVLTTTKPQRPYP